eukprot:TRINITY_DN1360_c0_g1_i2.p1 TRINITY_DN1360_c0_g1~~TRINITY_DN1360_c0_g1_i2.p1  ORF type:complete len:252 (+),score=62.30 TRINITY_DN1360_c0_g1_i2:204-959(+)
MQDPWDTVKEEVQQAVSQVKSYHERWRQMVNSSSGSDEFTQFTSEIQNTLKDIEWELTDLEDTIKIVEQNRDKFKITNSELQQRQQFILTTRSYIGSVKDEITRGAKAKIERDQREMLMKSKKNEQLASAGLNDKYSKLADAVDRDNDDFIQAQSLKQDDIKAATDRHLTNLSVKVDRLEQVSLTISDTLTQQNIELETLEQEVVDTDTRISRAIKSVNELIDKTNDTKQWGIICVLFLILIGLIAVISIV